MKNSEAVVADDEEIGLFGKLFTLKSPSIGYNPMKNIVILSGSSYVLFYRKTSSAKRMKGPQNVVTC